MGMEKTLEIKQDQPPRKPPLYITLAKRLLRLLVLLYLGFLIMGYLFADKLIFPGRNSYTQDSPGMFKIPLADGVQLTALYLRNPQARYTILYYHGNGEDLGDLEDIFREYYFENGFSVFAYDYRGYGTSGGKPSSDTAQADALAAFDYLVREKQVPPEKIILLGKSLGGAFACRVAAERPVAGLILESTFCTAFTAITQVPLLPFDRLKTIDLLPQVHCPVLVIHGTRDRLIPVRHGRRLYAAANPPKQCLWIENAGHNGLLLVAKEKYFKTLQEFTSNLR